ncbi:AAA family ATPase [Altererythrobacter sp. C41]|uniref:AAA family ATPase n=1 Tax=Altererythrobacter sp. C41 TaxID=2806021 RepID=UPI00193132B3|nr:ATP-binding protein [Altererythrobacter sp. C41]MBM0169429.1 ATP-binding protein [Altererythrobacter sp. C41]
MADTPHTNLYFTQLHAARWKNFSDFTISLQRRAFFVGANAAGKSNILDIFRFLRDLARTGGGFREAVESRGGVSAIRSLFSRKKSDVVIEVAIGTDGSPEIWRYRLAFSQDNNRNPFIIEEKIWRSGVLIRNRPDQDDKNDEALLSQTHLEQISANKEFRQLVSFFSSINYRHIVPQIVREPDRSFGRLEDPFGGDFLETVANTPKRTRDSRLRRIAESIKFAVPQLSELTLEQDTKGFWHLKGRYEHWRATGAWQTEDQFSDGTLRLMGLLWALMESGGALLLEEPELSLHPAVVQHLPSVFSRVSRRSGRQILVTTHSEALLADRGVGLDEVHLLASAHEGTRVQTAVNVSQVRLLLEGGITVADAVFPLVRPSRSNQLSLFDAIAE